MLTRIHLFKSWRLIMKHGKKTKIILEDAPLLKRAIAYAIDFSLEFILLFLLMIGINGLYQNPETHSQANFVLFCSIVIFIFLFLYLPTKHNGQTFGKMFFYIKTESTEDKRLGYWLNFAREFVFKFMFSLLLIPLEMIQIGLYYIKHHNLDNIRLIHDGILFTRVVSMEGK